MTEVDNQRAKEIAALGYPLTPKEKPSNPPPKSIVEGDGAPYPPININPPTEKEPEITRGKTKIAFEQKMV